MKILAYPDYLSVVQKDNLMEKGAGCGVVDKTPVSFTLEILSRIRFPAPPSKLLQAAVWSKRDYKAACISCLCQRQLANPSPPPRSNS